MAELLSPEAEQFGAVVTDALEAEGGVDLARAAEADPDVRVGYGELLGSLGVWDLDPSTDGVELEAAAAACRAAGRVALPYPVAERVAATGLDGVDALVHVDPDVPRVGHAGLGLVWRAVRDGFSSAVVEEAAPVRSRLGFFAADVVVGPWAETEGRDELARLVTLQCWTLLGVLDGTAGHTYRYVTEREQFGAPLASFQALRFALTDVEVHRLGLVELARYTLWSLGEDRPSAWGDALALRLAALEAAEAVFRICHQAHGAIGFCDESDLSWLSRHSQVLRRLPWGRSQTEAALVAELSQVPLAGPFSG
ncbi:acyl-CoA dehydrogenase family protein [Euzebya sp.]|uniref:acyl-CoA dehydrogenase family protein n=1 Tax=Euzebya sp. TaxID=1971409 RepID=UPI0035195792